MNDIKLRVARISDAAELLALYAPYVEETAISFETAVPSLDEFTSRMVHKLPRYPYIVAEKDGELSFIAIDGNISESELDKLIASMSD